MSLGTFLDTAPITSSQGVRANWMAFQAHVPRVLQRRTARREQGRSAVGGARLPQPGKFDRMVARDRAASPPPRATAVAGASGRRGTPAELAWLEGENAVDTLRATNQRQESMLRAAAYKPASSVDARDENILHQVFELRTANGELSQQLESMQREQKAREEAHSAESARWRSVQGEQTLKFKELTDELVQAKRESVEAMLALNGDRRSGADLAAQLRSAVEERDALRIECAAGDAEKRQWARDLADENTQLRALFDEVRTAKASIVGEVNALADERARLRSEASFSSVPPLPAASALAPSSTGASTAWGSTWRRLDAVCSGDERRARMQGKASTAAIHAFDSSIESVVVELRERHRR